jgi:hypothetical protein
VRDSDTFQRTTISNNPGNDAPRAIFNISSSHLEMFIGAILTTNANRSVRLMESISRFLHHIDYRPHQHDLEYMSRYFLLCTLLKYVLVEGIEPHQAVTLCNNPYYNVEMQVCLTNIKNGPIYSDEYLRIISDFVHTRLNYIYLWENSQDVVNLMTSIQSGTLDSVEYACEQAEDLLSRMYHRIRKRKASIAHVEGYGSDNEVWLQKAIHQRDIALKPGNRLQTGVQLLNSMLKGGLQRTRHYLLIMETGTGKSAFGLMLLYWILMYNRGIETSDPTRRPCILYLSHENLPGETLERELSFLRGEDVDISDLSNEDLLKFMQLKNELFGNPTDHATIHYEVRYFPVNTLSPEDVEMLIDEVEASHQYEVIGVINDYSKRMKYNGQYTDERGRLGGIVDSCKSIANTRNIFWWDFMQIRRFTMEKLESFNSAQQLGQVTQMNKTDVGESSLMIDNTDFAFAGTREIDGAGDKWMGLKILKWRGQDPDTVSFYQPFYPNSGMRLVEDIHRLQGPIGLLTQNNRGAIHNALVDNRFKPDKDSLPEYAGPQAKHPHQYTPSRTRAQTSSPEAIENGRMAAGKILL